MRKDRTTRVGLALGAAVVAVLLLGSSAWADVNLLLNPGFEEGYTTHWTLNAGSLDGQGLGEDPHSGSKSWHGAWQWSGGPQATTYYQDVPVSEFWTADASMWCKADAWGGVYGNDTHSFRLRVRFRDINGTNIETFTANSTPDNTWQQLVLEDMVAPAGTTHARILFSYITTQQAHEWKVWNIDDLYFSAVPEPASLMGMVMAGVLLLGRRRRN